MLAPNVSLDATCIPGSVEPKAGKPSTLSCPLSFQLSVSFPFPSHALQPSVSVLPGGPSQHVHTTDGCEDELRQCFLGPRPAQVLWECCFFLFPLPTRSPGALTLRPPTWHRLPASLPASSGSVQGGLWQRREAAPVRVTQIGAWTGHGGRAAAACGQPVVPTSTLLPGLLLLLGSPTPTQPSSQSPQVQPPSGPL